MKHFKGPATRVFRAKPNFTGRVTLADDEPWDTRGVSKKEAKKAYQGPWAAELAELQEKLWAQKKKSLLVVLQGLDTSGKDGTVNHVMSQMSVQGVQVVAFKQPTAEELRHDFLWRIKRHLPVAGDIVVFNRSHYEDVLIARVHGLAPMAEIEKRYDQINRFEAELIAAGTTVVKFMLHLSPQEQQRRFMARLSDPDKRWKFSENDLNERTLWNSYQEAYEIALTRCNPDKAPWYVVPADHKWFRNWVVSAILLETMRSMRLAYPHPRMDVRKLKRLLLSG